MRHNKKKVKLSRPRSQRKALLRSLCRNLFIYEKIKTTPAKAKELVKVADRVLNWAKKGTLHQRRLIYKVIGDHKLVKKICDDIALRFKDVSSGFTRIVRLGRRKGDGAEIAYVMLTKLDQFKVKKDKPISAESVKKQQEHLTSEPSRQDTPKKKTIREGIKGIFKKQKNK